MEIVVEYKKLNVVSLPVAIDLKEEILDTIDQVFGERYNGELSGYIIDNDGRMWVPLEFKTPDVINGHKVKDDRC